MKIYFINIVLFACFLQIKAQSFAPQVGFDGTTAIYKDDATIIDWANAITVNRGYKDIAIPNDGYVDYGVPTNALGQANNNVVSLGDGGEAVLSFNTSISNGAGADFAVFENAFLEEDGSELAFLELAFVEVSTDGIDYVRFPSITEVSSTTQMDSFGYINAQYIHNFAGKYIQDYGTPFDLSDLIPLINGTTVDLNNINFIKIIDVVGTINTDFATYDSENNIVNDPYPSNFSSGGFDLNAVGVIHSASTSSIQENIVKKISFFPNPSNKFINIATDTIKKTIIFSLQGKEILRTDQNKIDISFLTNGIYFISIETPTFKIIKKFIKV